MGVYILSIAVFIGLIFLTVSTLPKWMSCAIIIGIGYGLYQFTYSTFYLKFSIACAVIYLGMKDLHKDQ